MGYTIIVFEPPERMMVVSKLSVDLCLIDLTDPLHHLFHRRHLHDHLWVLLEELHALLLSLLLDLHGHQSHLGCVSVHVLSRNPFRSRCFRLPSQPALGQAVDTLTSATTSTSTSTTSVTPSTCSTTEPATISSSSSSTSRCERHWRQVLRSISFRRYNS